MPLIQELDYGTPVVSSDTTVTLTIDGQAVTAGECWMLASASRLWVSPHSDLLFAYPQPTRLALFDS